jgi:hypothetical protein
MGYGVAGSAWTLYHAEMTRSRWILALPVLLALVACVGVDPAPVAAAVAESLRPLLEKLGLSPEELAAVSGAMKDSVGKALAGQGGSIDWPLVLTGLGSVAASFFGINFSRNRARALRGEPVGAPGQG